MILIGIYYLQVTPVPNEEQLYRFPLGAIMVIGGGGGGRGTAGGRRSEAERAGGGG